MAVTVEKVRGINVHVVRTCAQCGAEQRLRVTMGESNEVTCSNCGHIDRVTLDERDSG